jgi:hypothetical protein
MRTKKLLLGLILFSSILFYPSCKKTDIFSSTEIVTKNSIEEKFFGTHRTTDPTEKALIDFLKRINDKEDFVEKTARQIGYPRWDKAFTKSKKTINSFQAILSGDSTEVFYIPFVRDSQNYVNASMVVRISSSDTSFSYTCDWQYASKPHQIVPSDTSAEGHALFFMMMDKTVFGHTKFTITDTTLFSGHSKENPTTLRKIFLLPTSAQAGNNLMLYEECLDYAYCGSPDYCAGECDYTNCSGGDVCGTFSICWTYESGGGGDGGTGTGTGTGGTTGGGGSGTGTGSTPPNCNNTTEPFAKENTNGSNFTEPCSGGGGWTPVPDEPPIIPDVISDPTAPSYPDISESDPQVSLQSLFNCFAQIPDAGATYSVKLCVDLPVNGVWNAPFNLTHKSPGHTFLTLTKTNGTQTISQSVGFYPIGSGGNPLYPTETGGFKNNGDPNHEYNAAVNAYNASATQFSMVMNNLLSHENDTYNIFNNNCTTIALNAFNLIITPPMTVEPFVVQMPTNPPQVPFYFMQSPQKLYTTIGSFQPGFGLSKEFNVNYDSPLSTNVCP